MNSRIELHTSIVSTLQATHDDIEAAIGHSSEPGADLLSRTDKLYANIEHPLSATLCHSATVPRATVSAHCSRLHEELQTKSEALERLRSEWFQCLHREEDVWRRIDSSGNNSSTTEQKLPKSQELVALQNEVDKIVEKTENAIDVAEAVSRHDISRRAPLLIVYVHRRPRKYSEPRNSGL